jgi:dCTP deaminase
MLLCDRQIQELCECANPLISPFVGESVKVKNGLKTISYGLSSYGYDIRLADVPLVRFVRNPQYKLLDVKNPDSYREVKIYSITDDTGTYFEIPPFTKVLGVSLERFDLPANIFGQCNGKSTYTRGGINTFVTPLEPSWQGFLTLEIANEESEPNKIYANEGLLQINFFLGDMPSVSYADRAGKYQSQPQEPVIPR